MSYLHAPYRETPDNLDRYVPLLLKVEKKFPDFVELPPYDRRPETVRTDIHAGLRAWLTHRWDCPLNYEFWEKNKGQVVVTFQNAKWYVGPKGTKVDPARSSAIQETLTESEVLHFFQEHPGQDVINACATLLQHEILYCEFRFAFDPKLDKKFDNVEVFKPEGEEFYVMM